MATIFPPSPNVNDEYAGYRWNGYAWMIIGIDLTVDYVTQLEFDGLIDSAPEFLDTLNELAAALGDDSNFATTVTNSLAGKVENSGDTITGPLAVEVSSTDAALRVTQTGTGDVLRVEDSANPDSTPLVVTGAGNVGIGTGSPANTLHISTASSTPLRLQSTTNLASIFMVDPVGGVFLTNDQSAFRVITGTDTAGSGGTERMRITNAGNVGIGTSSPNTNLEIAANSASSPPTIRLTDTDTTGAVSQVIGALEFYQSDVSGGADVAASISAVHLDISGNAALSFVTGEAERMRIMSGGSVGIGTSSPSYKLDVNGNARASNIMVIVDNGTDANYARPTGVGAVYWIGSAEPLNAAAYDMWWSV